MVYRQKRTVSETHKLIITMEFGYTKKNEKKTNKLGISMVLQQNGKGTNVK